MGKNKRPKSYYVQLAKKQKSHHNVLSPGLTGFLCTCNDRERECVLEAYNILNEYADQMYGKEVIPEKNEIGEGKSSEATQEITKEQSDNSKQETEKNEMSSPSQQKQKEIEVASDSDEEFSSLDAAIKADVQELQKESEKKHRHLRRFGQVATGAKNYVFIRSTLEDPLPLSLAIMDDILKLQRQKTKKLIRMIPVQATCKSFQDDIVKAVKNLCESYFREKGESFYIAIKVRNNSSIERESLKASLITVVSEAHSANTPELKDPEVVVNIDVIKNVCCISLLPGYFTKYCKYNLLSLGNKKENGKSAPKNEDNKSEVSEKEVEVK
ncbi:THUMP domain-containing protein 1-like [Portunus trituberculatus]|uniref:THUMP domain-containing protein 1-like n=1 Tax=Portunus trituberculatus TaxID=210409 RepID=UPI001E1CB61A|nr:THUMP domain-containing protein 1-like [Portunus trituberculatus]